MSDMFANDFVPRKANAEDLERLVERVEALERRMADQDERQVGTTAWLIREVRTVALMTPNEGIATLRIVLNMYDKAQAKAAEKARRG